MAMQNVFVTIKYFKPGPLFNVEAKKQISWGIPYTHKALIKIFDSDKHSSLAFQSADEKKKQVLWNLSEFFQTFSWRHNTLHNATQYNDI